ncbi:hypothetical protein B0A50_03143 [Salinomyces thailandicus]|uniref:Lysophospholipase A n=1 Tax=Salinomyces thailandicus TaxID=706561 RepID=A0A4V5N4Z5_9PEZI|nr:hypothetical protein B0A50_03143 [Salinomyces thailandica]
MSKSTTIVALAAILSIATAHPWPHKTSFTWASTRHLIAFGDSYTYVQGTHGHQNFSFIGDALNPSYTARELLSNRIVQNQTSTAEGGPNWVEYLTDCGVQPGLTNPRHCSKQLWDFAFAGADISTAFTPLHHNFTVSFVNQTEQFATYADPVLSRFIDKSRSLVAVWIGINDIGDSDDYSVDFPNFYNELQNTQFQAIEENIYRKGYKQYLFMNLPPLNRTPPNLIREAGPLPNATMVKWFDEALSRHATAFHARHPETEVMVFDSTTFLNYVLDSPGTFGVKNTTDYCAAYDQPFVDTDPAMYGCQPLEEFFWFNTGHMTSHTHEILAREVAKFLDQQ